MFSLLVNTGILLLCANISFSQQTLKGELDSLQLVIESRNIRDSIQAELISETAFLSYTNDLEYTKKLAEELGLLSREINYYKGIIDSHNLLGIYYDSKGDYALAKQAYEKSLELAKEHHHLSGISAALNNLGIIAEILGEYPEALDYYQQSIKIDEQLNDSLGKAKTLLQLGTLYESLSDTNKALNHYEESYKWASKLGNEMLMSYNLINIGYLYHLQGDNSSARHFFNQANSISERNQQQEGILLSCMMIGILDKEEKNYAKALDCFNKSLGISIKTGSSSNERYCIYHMADTYFRMDQLDKALNMAQQAYNPNDLIDENLQISTTELLSEIYARQGKFKDAFHYHKEFKKLQDHSFNEENLKRISQFEYEYRLQNEKQNLEIEQHKKEALFQAKQERQVVIRNFILLLLAVSVVLLVSIINNARNKRKANEVLLSRKQQLEEANQLLQQQKSDLEDATKELEIANQTKDKFFSIIAHDLRSPFTSIFGFSDILLESYHEFDEEELQVFLQKIKTSSESALILLENLFSWAGSNSGSIKFQPDIIPLKPIIETVFSLYHSASNSKDINLSHNIEETDEVFADLDMLRTILRNLVSNAIKFTNSGGEVRIDFKEQNDITVISVYDNGIGMNKDQTDQLFKLSSKPSSLGTHGEKGSGLGLVLSKEFIERHGGNILVESEISIGTKIFISFPKQ